MHLYPQIHNLHTYTIFGIANVICNASVHYITSVIRCMLYMSFKILKNEGFSKRKTLLTILVILYYYKNMKLYAVSIKITIPDELCNIHTRTYKNIITSIRIIKR